VSAKGSDQIGAVPLIERRVGKRDRGAEGTARRRCGLSRKTKKWLTDGSDGRQLVLRDRASRCRCVGLRRIRVRRATGSCAIGAAALRGAVQARDRLGYGDTLRNHQQRAEDYGQCRSHSRTIRQLANPAKLLFGLFCFIELLDVLGGVFVEVFQARLAAEFDLAAFVREHVGLHVRVRAYFLIRHDALIEWIGLGFVVFLVRLRVGSEADEWGCQKSRGQYCRSERFHQFHNFTRLLSVGASATYL
jgi:hypothetical protein